VKSSSQRHRERETRLAPRIRSRPVPSGSLPRSPLHVNWRANARPGGHCLASCPPIAWSPAVVYSRAMFRFALLFCAAAAAAQTAKPPLTLDEFFNGAPWRLRRCGRIGKQIVSVRICGCIATIDLGCWCRRAVDTRISAHY
jgi:hypothetical protein